MYDIGKRGFLEAVKVEQDNRDVARSDYDFIIHGSHWEESVRRKRVRKNKPVLTIPVLKPVLEKVINRTRQQTPSIRVKGTDNGDANTALVLEGIIRNIEHSSNASYAYDSAIEQALIGGVGYFRLSVDYLSEDSFKKGVLIERIPDQFSVYADPNSVSYDSSDWNDAWILFEANKEDYKDSSDFYVDSKIDKNSAKITLCEWFHRTKSYEKVYLLTDGSVVTAKEYEEDMDYYLVQGTTIKDEKEKVNYKVKRYILDSEKILKEDDWLGDYIPVVPVYGKDFLDHGKRVLRGLLSEAKDSQVIYNISRSTLAEMANLSPKATYIMPEGSVIDAGKWASMHNSEVPFVEMDMSKGSPIPIQPAQIDSGILNQAESALNDVKLITGIVEVEASSETGSLNSSLGLSTFQFEDNLARAMGHCGKMLLNLIPKVYLPEDITTILGEDGKEMLVNIGSFDGKYDAIAKAGLNYRTSREESVSIMQEVLRTVPDAAPFLGEAMIQNMDFVGKDAILAKLKGLSEPKPVENLPPTAEQQVLMLKSQADIAKATNDAKRLEIEMMRLKHDMHMDVAKLEQKAIEIDSNHLIKQGSLDVKQQEQNLKEFTLGTSIESKLIDDINAQQQPFNGLQ